MFNRREFIASLIGAGLVAVPSTKFIFDLGANKGKGHWEKYEDAQSKHRMNHT